MIRWAVFLITMLSMSFNADAIDKSRPDSIGGDYLVELNFGTIFHDDLVIYELGLDVERFIDGSAHHFSLGVSTDFEFQGPNRGYFFGPLVTAYFFHSKVFATTGLGIDIHHRKHWQTRVGGGYEFIFDDFIVIPMIAYNFSEYSSSYVALLGLAHEF